MSPEWTGVVYALRDPRDSSFRYVGMTDDAGRRRMQHEGNRGRNNAGKRRWGLELKLLGMKPVFEVLEECDLSEVCAREVYWIQKLTLDGHRLYNRRSLPSKNLVTRN